ncbi:MAG: hypothetical protein JNL74_14840 [Fibrobacteres bacterium]|nr:hypothetical protein [Fibrobacterota bacterium]
MKTGIMLSLLLLGTFVHSALNVPLDVINWSDANCTNEPVTAGICLPSGAVYDLSKLRITDESGSLVPAQFKWLSKWWWEKHKGVTSNPSAKWVLCDFQASVEASSKIKFTLRDDNTSTSSSSALASNQDSNGVTVITGPLKFIVSKTKGNLFDGVWLDVNSNGAFEAAEQIVASRSDNGGLISAADWASGECIAGIKHSSALSAPERVIVEENGINKIVIRVEGRHYAVSNGVSKGLYGYQVFITAFAGKPYVDVQWAVTNTYMEGSEPELGTDPYTVYSWPFQGYLLDLNLNLGSSQTFAMLGENELTGSLTQTPVRLLQKKGTYTLSSASGGTTAKGGAMVSDGALGVMVAMRDFAPNSPKAISLTQNKLSLELFPDTGSFYYLDQYSRKNHRMRFEFFKGAYQSGALTGMWKKCDAPLRMLATNREWYRDCMAWDRGFGVPPSTAWNRLNPSSWTRMSKLSTTDWVNYSSAGGYNGAGDHWNLTSGFWNYMLRGNPLDFEFAEGQTFYFNDMVNVHTSYTRWDDVGYYARPEEFPPLSRYSAHHSPQFRYQSKLISFPGFKYNRSDWPDPGHMPVMHVLEYYLLTGDLATRDAIESHGVKGASVLYYFIYNGRSEVVNPDSIIMMSADRNITRPIVVTNHAYEITGDNRYFHPMNIVARGVSAVGQRSPIGYLAGPWLNGYSHNIQGGVNFWCSNFPCSSGTQAQVEASLPRGYTTSDFQMGISHSALYSFWQTTHDENIRDALIFNGKFQEWSAGKKDTVNTYGIPVKYIGFQYSSWCDYLCMGKRYNEAGLECTFYSSNSEALGGLAFSYMVSGLDQIWQVLKDGTAGYPENAFVPNGNRMEMKIINLWEAVNRHDSLDNTPPEAVNDLSAQMETSASVRLNWTAPAGGAKEYQIKYGRSPIVDYVKRWDATTQTGWPDLTQFPVTYEDLNAAAINYTTTKEVSFWGAQNVKGEPTPRSSGSAETFVVTDLPQGVPLYFAIVSYDSTGNVSGISNVVSQNTATETGSTINGRFGIQSVYPNPFNPSVAIYYFQDEVSAPLPVYLKFYNVSGRVVRTLVSNAKRVGYHKMVWDGKEESGKTAASGMYVCELVIGRKISMKKVMLTK